MTARYRFQTLAPVLLMVVLAVVLTNIFPFRQMLANDKTIDLARAQLAEIRSENAYLEAEIEALNTDGELERLARADLGYVRPGEIAYVITSPDEPIAPESVAVTLPEPTPWYMLIWEFLTGEDRVKTSFR